MEGPLTIVDAMPLLRNGSLTPSDLLEQCLARMDVYEPHVKAWVYVDRERARQEAAVLTKELQNGRDRGPLHGIPIGIKDIIDVFDMPTGCGSKLWANSYARQDAEVVAKLRQAGALILGKTVTTQYAYLDPPPTRNPWNLERTPGGSSSGSAAAVACGMCLAALATQTGGSTIRPASYCGVYALKPSYGAISLHGVLPLAPSLDHIGIMAHGVEDLRMLFDAIRNEPSEHHARHTDVIVWPGFAPTKLDEAIRQQLSEQCALFHVTEEPAPDFLQQFRDDQPIIYASEAAAFHGERYRRNPHDYQPRIAELIETGLRLVPDPAPAERLRQIRKRSYIGNSMAILPATDGPAPLAISTGDPSWQSPWTYAGLPVLSVPFGWSDDGMPLALQAIGELRSEWLLFNSVPFGMGAHLPPVPR